MGEAILLRFANNLNNSNTLVDVAFYEKELEIIDRLDGELNCLIEQAEQIAEANCKTA